MAKKPETGAARKGSRPIEQTTQQASRNRRWIWIAAGVGLALVVLLAVVGLLNNRRSTVQPQAAGATESASQPVNRRIIGDPNAPVLIEAFEDYQCPHCQDFTAILDKTIREELVASGVARYQFQNRFVIDQNSVIIASAAECAADQGRFWEYHDQLFASLTQNAGASRTADLKKYAGDIGLNTGDFNKCLDTQEHYEAMLREDDAAKGRGVNATPTVFINGVQYKGAYEPQALKEAVEAAKTAKAGSAAASPEAAQ